LRRFVNDYVAPPKTATKLSLALEAFDRMTAEIASMGARSAHELMRCVEVSFIRDCAEMAAASSLMRDESRWGLYHSRVDLPERDDARWFHHLNLRKNADGEMEFVKRPVAEYLVSVDGVPHRPGEFEFLGVRAVSVASSAADLVAEEVTVESERVLEVLALVDSQPSLAVLEPYLVDSDVTVRRAAVSVLTEAVPPGFEFALVRAMADASVRDAAAAGLLELVEVVPASAELREALELSPARAVALEVLWALKLGTAEVYAAGLESADVEVRLAAVRGLVALREDGLLAVAAGDPSREVRVQVAKGITDVGVLVTLSGDADVLVRAAALEAAPRAGWPEGLHERAAGLIGDPAWEVRAGVARALDDRESVAGLLEDPNLDVRKAAVRALGRWKSDPLVVLALKRALDDTDADVRAYARMTLS
jgi:HEAT repeat protein